MIYLSSFIFFNVVIYKEDYTSERDFTVLYLFMLGFYAIANYFVYIRPQSENASLHREKTSFSMRKELLAYLKGEGKHLLAVYGVLAGVMELSLLLKIMPISVFLLFPFPLTGIFVDHLSIPVVQSVVSYGVTVLLLLALTLLEHYRVYRYWNMAKKGR